MNFGRAKDLAENYKIEMTEFLRDLVRIPGESGNEEYVIKRIKKELEKLDFDEILIDGMGNILGYMGTGEKLIAYDAHVDTVGIGEKSNWRFDPYDGYETDLEVGGRGTSDQLGGIVSAVYGAKIVKDMGLLSNKYRVLVAGTVQEEDCDGLCWQYIVNEDKIRPEFVVITEPTDGNICRGQRGRMEIRVEVKGVSCHGSAPDRGDNAIYKMADIIKEVRDLNDKLYFDEFLGKGTLTVSEIFFKSPSRCAVADMCAISIDRRLTYSETYDKALNEIRSLPMVKKYNACVSMYKYDKPSWTDCIYPTDCYFPTWLISDEHDATKAVVDAHKLLYGEPKISKWTFSTNGVSIMGRYGIPCIGFGPGKEKEAHSPNEKTWKEDLVKCAAVYSLIPTLYCK